MEDKSFRAKQFMPFDALKGFFDLIDEENIITDNKKVLSDDMNISLNNKIRNISKGDFIIVKYYYGFSYVETIGVIKKIDYTFKKIHIMDSIIDIEDIIDIRKIKN